MKNNSTILTRVTTLLSALLLYFAFSPVYAQNGVRIATTTGVADPSAMLDVISSTKGFLVPRMNLVGPLITNPLPVTAPADGLLIYNTGGLGIAAKGLYFWQASTASWQLITSGGLGGGGITDYVTRWTGPSALGTGVIRDDGTNVAIGAAPGTYKLNVQGGSLNVGTMYGSSVMYGTLGSFDTRATNPWPETYNMGVTSEFKANASNGLNDGGTYNSVLSVRQWNSGTDWSGGGVHQLAFTSNGNMWNRYSETTSAWGPWKNIVTRTANAVAFGYLEIDQTYTVPAGVTSLTVKIWGAGGGGGWRGGWSYAFSGGAGGFTTGTLAVSPGQVYYIVVGGGGGTGIQNNPVAMYGGGGRSCGGGDCQYCAQGGGRSAIRNTANTADLMTAGGGGGGGVNNGLGTASRNRGGAGGGTTGQNGECVSVALTGGRGGTQAAGGAGGTGAQRTGTAGVAYQGGQAGGTESYGGGAGGGWFGGGGGGYTNSNTMGGGGGGSGYIAGAGVTNASTTTGNFTVPAGILDPYYIGGVGVGGKTQTQTAYPESGGNGMVIIIPNK